jgi:hypothetical protein
MHRIDAGCSALPQIENPRFRVTPHAQTHGLSAIARIVSARFFA